MKLCVLSSGSKGNSIYIEGRDTAILIDSGISCKQTLLRLEAQGLDAEKVKAVCITHEHSDHIKGIPVLRKKMGYDLYANEGTLSGMRPRLGDDALANAHVFTTGSAFEIGELHIEPFLISHDSYEPVGFRVSDGKTTIGIATDTGVATALIRERLRSCDALVLEFNHDEQMLERSDRPWSLIQRIRSRQGHLSNVAAGELLSEVACERLQHVVLAHLSSDCNLDRLAEGEARRILQEINREQVSIVTATQREPTSVWEY